MIELRNEILREYEPYKEDMLLGRITNVHREMYDCLYSGKEVKVKVSGRFSYTVFGTADYPAVGDYVIFKMEGEYGIIHKVCSRYSELSRSDVGGTSNRQVMAVNVDIVFICVSLNIDFNIKKINELLALVYSSNAKPVVLLTKSDLCDNIDKKIDSVKEIDDLEIYPISVYFKEDINLVKQLIKNNTSVFLGASGVGKSTLVNKITGKDELKTNTIRESDSQGRHTTVNRQLFYLTDLDAAIIDTPGIRTINVFTVDDLDVHYKDIAMYASKCKFNNCTHKHEPMCAVQEALKEGKITEERFKNYLKNIKISEYNRKRDAIRRSRKR
ncbi:ribosome small subunit-dependent GTPase A [Mycoplasmatota bacterium]|nr:ribosome small subunit-dependent GTPase A [Mycoplasmatota bacterium]